MRGRAIALIVSLLGVPALASCGRDPVHPAAALVRGDARWEGVLKPTPELLVVVRPQALRQDKVYGALIARAIELAREHAPLVAETGALDAMEDAEEVIVGARESGHEGAGDFLVVVRGVRGNVDPANLVDEKGRSLWTAGPEAPAANVRELLRARTIEEKGQHTSEDADASLFELPGRTWIIATGKARARARDALALPPRVGSAATSEPWGVPTTAVALVRLSGPALVARVRALRPPGLLAPLGHKLGTLTVVLPPGEDGVVRTTLAYTDEQAVALAETTLREAIAALIAAKLEDYAWLRSATVQGSRCSIEVTARVPGPPGAAGQGVVPARSPAKLQLPL